MFSLRTRLAVLSSLISGVVIVLLVVFFWGVIRQTLNEAVDLKLSTMTSRSLQAVHPRAKFEPLVERADEVVNDESETGERVIFLHDDINEEVIYQSAGESWFDQINEEFLMGDDSYRDHFRNGPGRPERRPERRGGPPNGGKTENEDDFLNQFLDESRPRGSGKGNGAEPGGKGKNDSKFDNDFPDGLALPDFLTVKINGQTWRLAVMRDRGYTAMHGIDMASNERELSRILHSFWIGIPLALILIGGSGWFIANRALRPLKTITETASHISATELDQRIPLPKYIDVELSELIAVLNKMMNRLDNSFHHANRFSADVSHELKTPLAIMQAELETALKRCEPGSEEAEHVLVIQKEAQRLKAITASLMILAQADAGHLVTRKTRVSMTQEVEALCEDAEILCDQKNLELSAQIQEEIMLETDVVLLRQALQNLISNALKYNQEGGSVSVSLSRDNDEIVFSVANTGPGIPEADQKKVFDRFHRGDRSRSRNIDGFGLGLNLSLEIIRGLGGDLVLARASKEITKFEVKFGVE